MTIRERLLAATCGAIEWVSNKCSDLGRLLKDGIHRVSESLRGLGGASPVSEAHGVPEIFAGFAVDAVSDIVDDLARQAKGGIQYTDLILCEAGGKFQNETQAQPEAVNKELKGATKEIAAAGWQLGLSLFGAHTRTKKASAESHWNVMKNGNLTLNDALYGGASSLLNIFGIDQISGVDVDKIPLPKPFGHAIGAAMFTAFLFTVVKNWKSVWESSQRFGAATTRLRRAILAKLGFYVIEPTLPVPENTRSWATGTFNSKITYTWGYSWV